MVKYSFVILIFLLASCITSSTSEEQLVEVDLPIPESKEQCKTKIQNDSTWFPQAIDDFQPKGYQAKAAFPEKSGSSRVWVKGSESYRQVIILNSKGNAISQSVKLSPPYYIAFINVDSKEKYASAQFMNIAGEKGIIDSIAVISNNIYSPAQKSFSVLFYGCFEPFFVDSNMSPVVLKSQNDQLNYKMRNLFSEIALQQNFSFESYDQEGDSKGTKTSVLLADPVAIIGTGDQIYADAGYSESTLENHPLSAWAHICNNPYPMLRHDDYIVHLDKTYRNFYAFTPMEKALKRLPSFNVWDDHEIRDGWGSHGDEYNSDGTMNDSLAPYYFASREAFLDHQWRMGPQSRKIQDGSNDDLYATFEIKGVPVFAFDLRSSRNIQKKRVISDEQMAAFKKWCLQLKDNQEVIIVTSIPLFANTAGEKLVVKTNKEMMDDIHDSWEYNKAQRDSIISELVRIRARNIRPVLFAGDLHYGSITEIWYEKNEMREILAYEIIASGLNHETMGEHGSGIGSGLKDKREEPEWKNKETMVHVFDQDVHYFPSIRFSAVKLNFAAIEFQPGNKTYINVFIAGGKDQSFMQRRLEINWDKTYEQEKDERTHSLAEILRSSYTPPPIPYRTFKY